MHAIETDGLSRTFGQLDAVGGLDLQVPAGSIFALIGPNAAGKTTTIKMLMNLVRPTAGRPLFSACRSPSLAAQSGSASATSPRTRNCPIG